MAKDMRTWIGQLEAAGQLDVIHDEVSTESDIGRRLFSERSKGLLFDRVRAHAGWRVLGQAPASWEHIGLAFGVEPRDVVREFVSRVDRGPLPCRLVSSGPVNHTILTGSAVNLLELPIHIIAERDPAPFIAGGLAIVRDPETGVRNMAMHRLQLKGKNKLGIMMIAGKHTDVIYRKYEAAGQAMPVAIAIGHHPMYYFAAPFTAPFGVDELSLAGALLGEPVDLVRCQTIDLEAPAQAEIVLEGEIPPGVREDEGPFSEFTGLYPSVEERKPIVNVKAICLREGAIYKAVQSGALTESIFYNGLPMAAAVFRDLQNVGGYANVHSVSCNWGSTFNVVVQMTPRFYGEARQVLMAAASSLYLHQKIAVAVDEDVDINDPLDIAWAIATRVNPQTDITVVPDVRGHPLDNSLPEVTGRGVEPGQRLGSRLLVDATKPPTCDPAARAAFERAMPPGTRRDGGVGAALGE